MQSPHFELDSNFNQLENQDKTQLTAGKPLTSGEFIAGDIVGGTYEIIALIGSGGMGHVYRVRHTLMHQQYALKTLSAEQVNELAWRRFQNEAQAIARMNHPNVVGIYNLGLHDGRLPFYVMDFVSGRTLLNILRANGPMAIDEALSIFSEVCAGLGYAHKKGIVHRDIKPPNIILLDESEPGSSRVRIVDFGIAKLSGIKDKANQELTAVGQLCGSPYYMSPEQCQGERVDTRSDVYSLGCTLFEALTGDPPFKGRSAIETMLMHQSKVPPTLKSATGRQYPPMLEQAIATMLAKTPMDRYQNMELIIKDFSTILEGKDQAIRPYASQRQSLRPGSENMTELKVDAPPETKEEKQAKRQKKLSQTAGSLTAALTAAVLIVLVTIGLYRYLTPKAGALLITHFGGGGGTQTKSATASQSNTSAHDSTSEIIPQVALQSPGKSVNETKPYSTYGVKDNQRIISFDFPSDFTLGTLRTQGREENLPARGHLEYPIGVKLTLVPDPTVAKYPQYFSRFSPGDIEEVWLCPELNNNDTIKAVSNIRGLKVLELKGCVDIDDNCLPFLRKLESLNTLDIEFSSISGTAVARLPYIQRLTTVTFESGENADALCQALAGSSAVERLYLQNSKITAKGFKAISTLKNLQFLAIGGSEVSDRDLLELSKLPRLSTLSAVYCNINPDQIAILKKFPSLKTLDLDPGHENTLAKLTIRRGLNKVKVE
jgi:serine/threonine protein kinase